MPSAVRGPGALGNVQQHCAGLTPNLTEVTSGVTVASTSELACDKAKQVIGLHWELYFICLMSIKSAFSNVVLFIHFSGKDTTKFLEVVKIHK